MRTRSVSAAIVAMQVNDSKCGEVPSTGGAS